MSLLYNLFFPFLVSISMLLLLLGMGISLFLPPLGSAIHLLNSHYTHFVLNLTFNMPPAVDAVWHLDHVSEVFIVSYLCCLIWGGIVLKDYLDRRKTELEDLTFL